MVKLLENSLHSVIEELQRWESIANEHYIDYKIEEERNRLVSMT
jgi:hypothetical protein